MTIAQPDTNKPNLLEVNDVVKYFGGLAALDGISFKVRPGEIFGLIGPNGSGKTTLFDLITSRYPVDSGSIYFDGSSITGWETHKIARLGIGRTFQTLPSTGRLSVLENVMAAAFSRTADTRTARETALETLDFCGLLHRISSHAGALPYGERKRLEIARTMAIQPRLLLLDETVSGLNSVEMEAALALIGKIRDRGITIILVEHVMRVMMTLSDRIHAINLGRTIAEGTPKEMADHPAVIRAYLGEMDAPG